MRKLYSEDFHLLQFATTMQPRRRRCVRSLAEERVPKHFLKAILPSPIHANQLRIPEEFIARFGNELSTDHDATITVPDGRIWNMGLKKCGGHVFFSNNWEEFATYYCIGYGSYLVFKYEGNSKFSVVIFDSTSAEISYPFNKTRSTNGNGEPNYTNCPWKRSNAEISDADLPSEGDDDGKQVDESRCNRNQNVHAKRMSKSASERAKNAANEFKPKNPSFTSTIKLQRVYVPAEFASKYLKPKVPVKLQNFNGKQWQVSCTFNTARSLSLRLVRGFVKFAKNNDLSEGDTCVFELIKKRKPVVLQVTAFRAVDYGN